eukprot:TRINITY_DN2448_c0_g1_i1.p1 TRINITY_DN2448_c0_g1~~TRINITY_DN2448_c0_g1_i1.p1  ORF type:complete len:702 (-),score=189.16 TRINITY_DN2448_c0_g1_i1:87-2192(-)
MVSSSSVLLSLVAFLVVLSAAQAKWEPTNMALSVDQTHRFTVGLKQQNLSMLEKYFWAVADPSSPQFQNYLTADQLTEMVGALPSEITAVSEWFRLKGAQVELVGNDDALSVTMTLAQIEDTFKLQMLHHRHSRTDKEIVRSTTAPVLPQHISDSIDLIVGLNDFPNTNARLPRTLSPKTFPPAPIAAPGEAVAAPVVRIVYASKNALIFDMTFTCPVGEPAPTSLASPCSSPATFHVKTLLKGLGTHMDFDLPYSSTDCQLVSGGQVHCTLVTPDLFPAYQLVSPTIAVSFGNGPTSPFNNFFNVAVVTSDFVTPQLLNELYGIDGDEPSQPKNSQSVAEFIGQYLSSADLTSFLLAMGVPEAEVIIKGPNNQTDPGEESMLDIQWQMAMSPHTPTYFWSVGDNKYLLEWAMEVTSSSNPPLVHSISYSDNESDTEKSFLVRVDSEFQKMGAMGISVMVSSGDAGATNIGHGSTDCTFDPQWPSTSPYITSVGATYLTPAAMGVCGQKMFGSQPIPCETPLLEVAVAADNGMVWTTGGGFSNYYTQAPPYQKDAVNQYLKKNQATLPPANMFNANGRAYPDVAAIGHNLIVKIDGEWGLADGTSASSPIFSAVISRINARLIAANLKPLGFLNNFLYSLPQGFFDVIVGDNSCGDVLHPPHVACCPDGFSCAIGWDPVTGMGTPRYGWLLSGAFNWSQRQ